MQKQDVYILRCCIYNFKSISFAYITAPQLMCRNTIVDVLRGNGNLKISVLKKELLFEF